MMPIFPLSLRSWVKCANSALDSLLYGLSIYGAPVLVGLVSVLALFAWEGQYATSGQKPLAFRVFEQTGNVRGPVQALEQLGDRPAVGHYDTKLSESPFWFGFEVLPTTGDEAVTIELPSRHAMGATCWNAVRPEPLGSATRNGSFGQARAAKTGFVIDLGKIQTPATIVCRANFVGPARISLVQWPAQQLESSNRKFHRDSGLLEGGIIVLALFVLLTALFNREWIYIVFAAWLIANLRLAAISAGWRRSSVR